MKPVQLFIGGAPSPWGLAGLSPQGSPVGSLASTSNATLVWPSEELPSGALEIAFDGVQSGADLDGIECAEFISTPDGLESSDSLIDHVVVMTNNLERTCEAVTEVTGCPLKRLREVGEIRQGFHRVGEGGVILEVVERADVSRTSLWGLVIATPSFDDLVQAAGDLVSEPKDAVQPGRRISTVKTKAGLGIPVALMTP
ncbi:MAG: VOC family protein [Ilumatobacteraceae bacterium]